MRHSRKTATLWANGRYGTGVFLTTVGMACIVSRGRPAPGSRRYAHSARWCAGRGDLVTYTILIDGSPVETAGSEAEVRLKAEAVQANAGRYVDDEFGGAFALVGFAPVR